MSFNVKLMVKFENDATRISRDHMNADVVEKDTLSSATLLDKISFERNYLSCELCVGPISKKKSSFSPKGIVIW